MATLYETLKNNPYKNIIIPVIAELSKANASYEDKAAVAEILMDGFDYWGGPTLNATIQAGPERGQREGDSRHKFFTKRPTGRNVLTEPTIVLKTKQALEGLNFGAPNAWIFYNQIVDVFYAYVDFLSYFAADYHDGIYANDILAASGLMMRAGASLDGLVVKTDQQGSAGPAPANTNVVIDTVVVGDAGKYFTAYSDNANLEVVWLRVDATGSAPVIAPIEGVTINYVQVDLLSTGLAGENKANVRNAINTAARMSAINGVGTDVIVSTLTNGEFPVTTDQDIPTSGAWAYSFVNGTTDPVQAEITEVDVSYVVPLNLNSKYFTMDDGARKYGFWFNVDNGGSLPTMPGVTDPVQIRANSVNGKLGIKTELDIAIGNLGVWTIDSQTEFTTDWISPATGGQTDSDAATAGRGIANASLEIKGADDSVLYTAPGTSLPDAFYAIEWNAKKVPYDASIGVVTPYLKSATGGSLTGFLGTGACNALCGAQPPIGVDATDEQVIAWSAWNDCDDACRRNAGMNVPDNDGVFITVAYNPDVATLGFNKPGTAFDVHASERGKAVL